MLFRSPGITDISSIVFYDLDEIVGGQDDINLAYNQLVRPWKSKLILLYMRNANLCLDVKLIFITIISIFSKSLAIRFLYNLVAKLTSDEELLAVVDKKHLFKPSVPPGADSIVTTRGC